MKEKILYVVVILTLFLILFAGSMKIGPISIRNLCMIGLLACVLTQLKNIRIDLCQKAYLVYLAVLIFCNIINGLVASNEFIQNMIVYHFVCVILILSLPLIVDSLSFVKIIITSLAVIYILNGIASALQFYNSSLGWSIGLFFAPQAGDMVEKASTYESLLKRSFVMGITGFVVTNGYFIASFVPVVAYKLLSRYNSVKSQLFAFALLLFAVYLAYCIQQRTAMIIILLYIMIITYLRTNYFSRIIIVLLSIVFIVSPLFNFSFDIDMGRLTMDRVSNDARMNQFNNVMNYFNTEYFIFGGNKEVSLLMSMGHNTFTDALRRGGFITLIAYIFLAVVVVIECGKKIINAIKFNNQLTLALALSCTLHFLYSFTHSSGIQSGAIYFWLFYTLMNIAEKYETEENTLPN